VVVGCSVVAPSTVLGGTSKPEVNITKTMFLSASGTASRSKSEPLAFIYLFIKAIISNHSDENPDDSDKTFSL